MRKQNRQDLVIRSLARAISDNSTATPKRGARNPFRVFARVRSDAWRHLSDFSGSVSTSRGIVRK